MTLDRCAPSSFDVIVIGGGLAGLATSIHLSRAGFSVVCLEPVEMRERIVGESLDWSAPELLKELGLEMEQLVETGIATYKRHVCLRLQDGSATEYVPSAWLGEAPFHIELRTLHVDRSQLDAAIRAIAVDCGVQEVRDRAVHLEWDFRRIAVVVGESGVRYQGRWFVDASGYAGSFLGRQLGLPTVEYGPKKVGIWSYFETPNGQQSTTLYAESSANAYLKWMWQIPIAPGAVSVGLVTSGPMLKSARSQGDPVAAVFRSHMERFEGLRPLLTQAAADSPRVTSFSCRVFKQISGLNWVIAGEAAAVPDPITANGVTSALRHASEAAALIISNNERGALPWLARKMYDLRVTQMCRFFDSLVEKLVYRSLVRDRFGLCQAGDFYTTIAWSMNHLYSRFRPRGVAGTILFCAALSGCRAMGCMLEGICRVLGSRRQTRPMTAPNLAQG